MPYTRELKELIKKVEETRPARVEKKRGEEFPLLSLKEREERLEKYHPDFKEGSRTEIRVGPIRVMRSPLKLWIFSKPEAVSTLM